MEGLYKKEIKSCLTPLLGFRKRMIHQLSKNLTDQPFIEMDWTVTSDLIPNLHRVTFYTSDERTPIPAFYKKKPRSIFY